jgi:two-component system chemotaxis response regulator CheY
MNILIVDDALFLRVTLKSILERNGHTVVGEAIDGKDAVEKYKTLQPDLVTMDITMPRMNGINAMKAILEDDPTAKVVMCSAMGRGDFQAEAMKAGASGFITKPFDEKKINQILKDLL